MSTVELSSDRDAVAPDGSEVRVLVGGQHGSMAHFTLPAGETSGAVGHLTLEELWYFISGEGEMWRRVKGDNSGGERTAVRAGVSVA
jgi:mannose-6-phosphate isomerase-like protein (cupin superfamily)